MIDTKSKTVEGFSQRFTELLDKANFPQKGRFSRGSEQFGVNVNTFALWCQNDQPPRMYSTLLEVITQLLADIPGDYDPQSVAAWLYAGKSVPHPFEEYDVDFTLKGDIYLVLMDKLQARGMKLEPDVARDITFKVYRYVIEQRNKGKAIDSIKTDQVVKTIIGSKLDLISYGIDS